MIVSILYRPLRSTLALALAVGGTLALSGMAEEAALLMEPSAALAAESTGADDSPAQSGDSTELPLRARAPSAQKAEAWLFIGSSAAVILYLLAGYKIRSLSRANRQLRGMVDERAAALARESLALEERNAELEARNSELRALAQRASGMAEAKSRFLAMMSHEIRTPMNGVMGMCALLGRTELGGEQLEYVDSIRSSGQSLLGIIDDILDYSKIEEGRLELELIRFDAIECVESVCSLLGPQACGKGVELHVTIAEGLRRWRHGDPMRVRQLLINLVGNALKFTREGFVAVSLRDGEDGEDLVLEVRDTGIGIEPAKQQSIFEPFFQGDISNARRFGGTGLGLSICRQIVVRMGGTIELSSEPGIGSVFKVCLPCPAADEAVGTWAGPSLDGKVAALYYADDETRAVLASYLRQWGMEVVEKDAASLFLAGKESCGVCDVVLVEHKLENFSALDLVRPFLAEARSASPLPVILLVAKQADDLREGLRKAPTLRAMMKPIVPSRLLRALQEALVEATSGREREQDGAPPQFFCDVRALVVEDNRLSQDVALRLLRRLGVEATLAEDGRQAAQACRESRFDVVFMDVQMPVMDGIEATKEILADSQTGCPPLIYGLSAGVLPEERNSCAQAGMTGFIGKPFAIDDLIEALTAARRRKETVSV